MWLARYSPALFPLFLFRKIYHRGHGGRSLTAVKPWVTGASGLIARPARIRSAAARVRSVRARVQSLTARVQSLTARVGSLTARFPSLTARVRSLTARVRSLATRVRASTARVQALRARLEVFGDRMLAKLPDPVANAPGSDTFIRRAPAIFISSYRSEIIPSGLRLGAVNSRLLPPWRSHDYLAVSS